VSRSDLLRIRILHNRLLENMYNGTEGVPDDVIWNVAPLRRKYANKFERRDADTLCTQQYTLYIVGTFRHVAINRLQPVVEAASELKGQQDKKRRPTWLVPSPIHLHYQ
jgi:hypothetical protein